jgi:glycerol-3-phosphate acyltransferase PlsY
MAAAAMAKRFAAIFAISFVHSCLFSVISSPRSMIGVFGAAALLRNLRAIAIAKGFFYCTICETCFRLHQENDVRSA